MLLIYTLIIVHAQPTFPAHSKHMMEIGGGVVGSFVGWTVGYNAGSLFECDRGQCRTIALSSALFSSSVSTYFVGEMFDRGNFLSTLLGGMLFGIVSNALITDEKSYKYYIVSLSFPLGETLGYNLFKRSVWEETP